MLTLAVWLAWTGVLHIGFAGLRTPGIYVLTVRILAAVALTTAAILATIAINR